MGLIIKVKVNGEYLLGFKRFAIGFILGVPLTLMFGLFISMFIPMIILLGVVLVGLTTVKVIL
jgi:hypothetical protein